MTLTSVEEFEVKESKGIVVDFSAGANLHSHLSFLFLIGGACNGCGDGGDGKQALLCHYWSLFSKVWCEGLGIDGGVGADYFYQDQLIHCPTGGDIHELK